MPEPTPALVKAPAIRAVGLSKTYRLYRSPLEQFADALGAGRMMPWRRRAPAFHALTDVSLEINVGERVGILGRNGAGKSTLLKLIGSKLKPSRGTIEASGNIHTLMDLGLGFHSDYSGIDNIRASLAYNGLDDDELNAAIEDVIEFCELGDYIHQPLKTYSAGMRVRLHFATATAIKPDILIVDEVLGAGDHYFAARSADRMRRLATGGCTLLLVSHSLQQVIEYCDRSIWLERGRIVMQGPTLAVVKAYEEFIQVLADLRKDESDAGAVIEDSALTNSILQRVLRNSAATDETSRFISDGGISRWPSTRRICLENVSFHRPDGTAAEAFGPGEGMEIAATVRNVGGGSFCYRACFVLFDESGRWITRLISPRGTIAGSPGIEQQVRARLAPLLLSPGRYVVSASLHEDNEPWDIATAERFDLISRSFTFEVMGKRHRRTPMLHLSAVWLDNDAG
jgi:lipopolysaccharide transport system ATP-binding protein